jgi:hypothetical protein
MTLRWVYKQQHKKHKKADAAQTCVQEQHPTNRMHTACVLIDLQALLLQHFSKLGHFTTPAFVCGTDASPAFKRVATYTAYNNTTPQPTNTAASSQERLACLQTSAADAYEGHHGQIKHRNPHNLQHIPATER